MLTMCMAPTLYQESKTKTSARHHTINKCQIIRVSIFRSIKVPVLSSRFFSNGTIES